MSPSIMSSSSCCSSSAVEKCSDDDFRQPKVKAERQNRHNNNNSITNNNNSNASLDESVGCHSFDSAHGTLIQVTTDIRTELSTALISHGLLAAMISCVIIGYAYPKLGAYYVLPDITANWIAVIIIFFISGLSMDTATIIHAAENVRFNTFIQVFNFGFVSVVCYLFSLLMKMTNLLPISLTKGLVICSCLPQSICSATVLTKSANGSPSAAMINAVFSNLAGIVLSPILIFLYLGVSAHVDSKTIVPMLLLKVALPFSAGQLVYYLLSGAVISAYDHPLKVVQEGAMVFIIFATFSQLFAQGTGTTLLDVVLMVVFQSIIMMVTMLWVWLTLKMLFLNEAKFHATGLFLSVSKTMPLSIPLINTLYKDHPHLALYTLPLLVWYPLTIVMGILIAPKVSEYVRHTERKIRDEEEEKRHAEMMDYHQAL